MKQLATSGLLVVETRRLLRHLDEPKSLRANPLVAHLFEHHSQETALAAARALVHQALDAMVANARYARRRRVERFREILKRFDITGEAAEVVASDLGLSVRQFYRERRLACIEVGTLLRARTSNETAQRIVTDLYDVAQASACNLVVSGAPMQGMERFLALAAQASRPLDRIASLCDAAMIMIELYDVQRARETIAAARRVLVDSDGISPHERREARDLIDFADALTLWDAPDRNAAEELARHTMLRASSYIQELSPWALRRHATERIRYAGRKLAQEDPLAALRFLHDGEPYIDALGARARFLRVDYANVRCGIELRTASAWDDAARLASDAYDESRKQGYLVGAATALRSMAIILAERGDGRAAELADALLDLARSNCSPRLLAYAQIGAADIYMRLHRYDRAIGLTRTAIPHLHDEPLQVERARRIEARALLALRSGGSAFMQKLPSS